MAKIAYLDESGTSNLNVESDAVSNYFIVAAILINAESENEFLAQAELLRQKHFNSSEIKSASIRPRKNHQRRKQILDDVMSLDFKFYALAVDKREINQDSGLRFRRSFIKFINGKIYSALFQHFAEITLYADEHGDQEFISSLESYVRNSHIPDLFINSEFYTVKSIDCLGAQIADFIAGTMAQVYEGKADSELEEKYLELIKAKSLGVDEWPRKYSSPYLGPNSDESIDSVIREFSSNQAHLYLDQNIDKNDLDTKMKVCVLKYLLFSNQWVESDKYIPTELLKQHLYDSGYRSVTIPTIRTNLVAQLRDDGVIIASSNNGYKIPSKLSDMYDFAVRVDSQVVPLLKRLQKAKDSIYLASSGEVDILDGPQFRSLAKLIETLD